jgi:hypothetical protein
MMTETTKRILIAAVAAVVLIAGSVAAIALVDDSDDDRRDGPLVALAEQFEGQFESGDLLEGLIERFLREGRGSEMPDRIFDLFDALRDDLIPRGAEEFGERDAAPPPKAEKAPKVKPPKRDEDSTAKPPKEEKPSKEKAPKRDDPGSALEVLPFFGEGFLGDSPLDEFLEDGRITPEEAAELERWLETFGGGIFGFGFGDDGFGFDLPPFEGFAFPQAPQFGVPFGGLPLDEFLEDGRISPDEARELERLFRDSFPGGVFRFEFVPPETDRPLPGLPDALFEGLRDMPFREFFADGELTPREREALRQAMNEWLSRIFERFDAANG